MDFSQDVLIETGLNIAGYLIVALLVLLLVNRRQAPKEEKAVSNNDNRVKKSKKQKIDIVSQSTPEFLALNKSKGVVAEKDIAVEIPAELDENTTTVFTSADRQKNRREIYKQARKLMAGGKSNNELLEQLPLTEDEVELISTVGNA